MIDLRNIPIQQSENKLTLRKIVKTVGDLLAQPISECDIRDVLVIRNKPKNKDQNTSPILVEFTTVSIKDNLIKNTRDYNKQHTVNKINTSNLKLPGPS
ncbi:unnamed protein product [Arctia plantaginis]|uniref:Uncharacterized protein n=1 Tax=Arctia plantaginis TaxID=874455 RepID=A0A8S0YWS5_ARCPL|nr:unnamed protein product [Arctia plantaginis]